MLCQSCESAPGLHRLEVVVSFGERKTHFACLCDRCIRSADWYCERHERGKILIDGDGEFNTPTEELAAVCLECCRELALTPSDEDVEAYLEVFAYCECEQYVAFGLSVARFWEVPETFTEARRMLYALAVGAAIEDTSVETALTHCLMQAAEVRTLN